MLSRSKSEDRKTSRPEIIHLRKPSLSHSVSSAESTSTSRSAQSSPSRHTYPLAFDPLSLHPTFAPVSVPPPRLSERPFILTQEDQSPRYSGVDEDEILEHYFRSQDNCKTDSMLTPPTDSPTPMAHANHQSTPRPDEGGDYFLYKLRLVEHQEQQKQAAIESARTSAPCQSRWSMSTIDTDDGEDTDATDDTLDTEEYDDDEEPVLEMAIRVERPARHAASYPNFSYKRDPASSPRRPPMKTMDSVEDFIKRGGWKRRGIVFQSEDAARIGSSMF